MPKIRLSDRTLAGLKSTAERVTYWDATLPSFGVRVGANRKTFIVIQSGGHRRKLGLYPHMTLAQARKAAVLAIHSPKATKLAPPCGEAVETYLRTQDLRPTSLKEKQRLLTKHFLSRHAKKPLSDITTQDIVSILDNLRTTPSEALHVYRALKAFGNWAVSRELIDQSPLGKLSPPSKDTARERILSDEELQAISQALYGLQDIRYPAIVRLLMLTGQRLSQITGLRKSWVDEYEKIIRFPGAIMKNGKDHELPFGRGVKTALWRIMLRDEEELFDFSGFANAKRSLDKRSGVTGWTLHDLRRTYASNAARLGVSQPIIERILAHSTPGGSSLHLIYNRHKYREEMVAAINAIDRLYEKLLAS